MKDVAKLLLKQEEREMTWEWSGAEGCYSFTWMLTLSLGFEEKPSNKI